MITLSPQCCWLLGLGQISGTPPRSIKKPRKMSSRCDPGRAKKTPIPSTAPLVLNLLATLGHILHLDASSLWLLCLCFFWVPFLFQNFMACTTLPNCFSLYLSLESRLLSVSLPCGFGVSWRSGHVSCFAGKLACCCCSYMRLLLLPHHDYDYDDYNNCYLLLLLLLFLLLQMMILDPTSNYDDGDADSTKQLKVTLFASLQWWCWWRWCGPQWKPPNYPRTNFGTTDDEWSLNEKKSSYTIMCFEKHC